MRLQKLVLPVMRRFSSAWFKRSSIERVEHVTLILDPLLARSEGFGPPTSVPKVAPWPSPTFAAESKSLVFLSHYTPTFARVMSPLLSPGAASATTP
jgi:hypothetical protein